MDLTAFDLKGKVALVTGGAHGIGFSIAEGMAKCGATVCFNCSNEGSLEKGIAAYKEAGVEAHGYVADVTDEAAVNAAVAQIVAEAGHIDLLVNNAGVAGAAIATVLGQIIAYDTDIDEGEYQRLRGRAIRDMKRTNGRISFKDALDFQKSV